MRDVTYTVLVGGIHSRCTYSAHVARRAAIAACREHPHVPVFVKFYRRSDGCIGHLNRDGGYDITGRNWQC